jgi:hypothetical protein
MAVALGGSWDGGVRALYFLVYDRVALQCLGFRQC